MYEYFSVFSVRSRLRSLRHFIIKKWSILLLCIFKLILCCRSRGWPAIWDFFHESLDFYIFLSWLHCVRFKYLRSDNCDAFFLIKSWSEKEEVAGHRWTWKGRQRMFLPVKKAEMCYIIFIASSHAGNIGIGIKRQEKRSTKNLKKSGKSDSRAYSKLIRFARSITATRKEKSVPSLGKYCACVRPCVRECVIACVCVLLLVIFFLKKTVIPRWNPLVAVVQFCTHGSSSWRCLFV